MAAEIASPGMHSGNPRYTCFNEAAANGRGNHAVVDLDVPGQHSLQ